MAVLPVPGLWSGQQRAVRVGLLSGCSLQAGDFGEKSRRECQGDHSISVMNSGVICRDWLIAVAKSSTDELAC